MEAAQALQPVAAMLSTILVSQYPSAYNMRTLPLFLALMPVIAAWRAHRSLEELLSRGALSFNASVVLYGAFTKMPKTLIGAPPPILVLVTAVFALGLGIPALIVSAVGLGRRPRRLATVSAVEFLVLGVVLSKPSNFVWLKQWVPALGIPLVFLGLSPFKAGGSRAVIVTVLCLPMLAGLLANSTLPDLSASLCIVVVMSSVLSE